MPGRSSCSRMLPLRASNLVGSVQGGTPCVIGALLLTAVTSCAPAVPGDWEEENWDGVRLHTHPGTTVCGGDARRIRALADEIAGASGQPRIEEFSYYLLEPGEVGEYCSGQACSDIAWNRLFAPTPDNTHELSHLVLPEGTLFFSEGLAEHFKETHPFSVNAPFDVMGQLHGPDYDIRQARTLVSFLIEEFGLDTVIELMERTNRGMRDDDFLGVYSEIFGTNPNDQTRLLPGRAFNLHPWNICRGYGEAERLSIGSALELMASCDDGYGRATAPQGRMLVEVEPGTALVQFDGDVLIESCDPGRPPVEVTGTTLGLGNWEGRYILETTSPMQVAASSTGPAGGCGTSTTEPLLIAPDVGTVLLGDLGGKSVPFTVEVTMLATAGSLLGWGLICDSACQCDVIPTEPESALVLTAGETYWFGVQESDPSLGPEHVLLTQQ